MKRNESDDNAVVGCLIILFGICASIGGLLYFIRILIALYAGEGL